MNNPSNLIQHLPYRNNYHANANALFQMVYIMICTCHALVRAAFLSGFTPGHLTVDFTEKKTDSAHPVIIGHPDAIDYSTQFSVGPTQPLSGWSIDAGVQLCTC